MITAEELEARQVQTLADALRSVPGIQLSSNGGMGTISKVFIRGADSRNTLLLIDGVMANDTSETNRGLIWLILVWKMSSV